ncbi:DUF1963 domain-containing protein [Streptomyces sp. NPDC090029]|uniref:DUF1963 domain-containing protein n=1 Tax=Streptomyces sp. NPDC090029 TaxID=3365924 RepID=UPI00381838BA
MSVLPWMIGRMTHGSQGALRALASQHLSLENAEKWLGLLRPGARLEATAAPDGGVGRLGGLPALPAGAEWPAWDGHGPLSFIASPRGREPAPTAGERSRTGPGPAGTATGIPAELGR